MGSGKRCGVGKKKCGPHREGDDARVVREDVEEGEEGAEARRNLDALRRGWWQGGGGWRGCSWWQGCGATHPISIPK